MRQERWANKSFFGFGGANVSFSSHNIDIVVPISWARDHFPCCTDPPYPHQYFKKSTFLSEHRFAPLFDISSRLVQSELKSEHFSKKVFYYNLISFETLNWE